MSNNTLHVVPAGPKGGWNVKKGGAERASGHFDTKEKAVKTARVMSRNQKSELVIHNRNGRIAQKDSHGKDPFPPRG